MAEEVKNVSWKERLMRVWKRILGRVNKERLGELADSAKKMASKETLESLKSSAKRMASKENIDSLKASAKQMASKENVDSLKASAKQMASKENLEHLSASAKDLFSKDNLQKAKTKVLSLRTAEGRAVVVEGFKSMPTRRKVFGSVLAVLALFLLCRIFSNDSASADSLSLDEFLERFEKKTSLREVCHAEAEPKKGRYYMSDSMPITVYQAMKGVVFAVPTTKDGGDRFLDIFKKDPLFHDAVVNAQRVTNIAVVTDDEYAEGEPLRPRFYRYVGPVEYKLVNGAKTKIRTFVACSEETTIRLARGIDERRKAVFMKWFSGRLPEIDLDIKHHVFAPKKLGVGFCFSKDRDDSTIGRVGFGAAYGKFQDFSAAQAKGDHEACAKIMGLSVFRDENLSDELFEEFCKMKFHCNLTYKSEDDTGVELVEWDVMKEEVVNEMVNHLNEAVRNQAPTSISGPGRNLYCIIYSTDYKKVCDGLYERGRGSGTKKEKMTACRKFLEEYVSSYPEPKGGFPKNDQSLQGLDVPISESLRGGTILGITFGSSPRTVEAKVGQRLTEALTWKNVKYQKEVEADYLLKQPFRKFTKVRAIFDNFEAQDYFNYRPMKNPEDFLPSDRKPIVVLRKLLFMGVVDLQKTSRASCLEELAKVKDLLAEKYEMDFKGDADCLVSESRNDGSCVNIKLRFNEGFEMEVEHGLWDEIKAFINTCAARAEQKAKEADSKKATINISDSAGKDQL